MHSEEELREDINKVMLNRDSSENEIKRKNEIKEAWAKEYKRKGIPSSFRKDPTKAVVEFIAWLKEKNKIQTWKAADIGCGRGRNSFYLASQGFKVTGIELLEDNVDEVNATAKLNHWPIQAFCLDASTTWPITSDSLDIVIDVFCYKHIVNKEKQLNYRKELWRTLKNQGFYFISTASEDDGFYGPLLEKSTNSEDKLIIDPYSNIASFLYSTEGLSKEFFDSFEAIQMKEQTSSSPMYGKEYSRRVINAIFRKKKLHKFYRSNIS